MKPLLLTIAFVLCCAAVSACGKSTEQRSSGSPLAGAVTVHVRTAAGVRGLQGDEDDDDSRGESKTYGHVASLDADQDEDDDTRDNLGKRYFDADDGPVERFGRPAGGERRALDAVVEDYLRAGAARDGVAACALIATAVGRTAVQEYGQDGPGYLRGAKTCPQLLDALLAHLGGRLRGTIELTGARLAGRHAYVLLGAAEEPATYVALQHEAGHWRLGALIPFPLP